jgi:hypothetical protein
MSRMNRFREIERSLEQRTMDGGSTVLLENDDFRDGKLTAYGYERLKRECLYIGYGTDIEIVVPRENEACFRGSLENMAAVELSRIKKDRYGNMIKALLFLIIGAALFLLGAAFRETTMFREITIVATWVFLWTAFEKLFFDRDDLRDRRLSLLHILSAGTVVRD